eukprot:scaffold141_cov232-Pinguiococcus_pyrenoidosus.AAC.3
MDKLEGFGRSMGSALPVGSRCVTMGWMAAWCGTPRSSEFCGGTARWPCCLGHRLVEGTAAPSRLAAAVADAEHSDGSLP